MGFILCSVLPGQTTILTYLDIPLHLLTLKTVFLTLLASGARRGEIHAIAYSTITHAPNWTNIVLSPVPGFIYQNPNTGPEVPPL